MVMLVVCGGGQFAKSLPSVGFLALAHHKPVTTMPVLSLDLYLMMSDLSSAQGHSPLII